MEAGVSFGPFSFDFHKRELSRDGTPVKLAGRALDILFVLASAKGEVVSKDELMARVWPDLVVEENNIEVHISALRKILGEGKAGYNYVITVPGHGYRLVSLRAAEPVAFEHAGNALRSQLSNRPSIAVMPFQNMSGGLEQEYFADGVVEEIITGLSRIKWLFVIARNSTFAYKGKAVDARQVGGELAARYLLEGSVRKSGNRVRITAQLIDAQTAIQLWGERYDRLFDDIFAVQDEITMSVIGAIEPNLRKVEVERVRRKRPDNLDAYDFVLRALPFTRHVMVAGAAAAIPLLEKALALEPEYAFAQALLARCYHIRYSRGGLREEDRLLSIRHARAAVAAGSDDATALAIAGLVLWLDDHDIRTAFELFDRALAISNSNITALSISAFAFAWMGKTEAAIERASNALHITTSDPWNSYLAFMAVAVGSFHAKRYEESRDAAMRAIEANPEFSVPHVLLAAALSRLNQRPEATAAVQRVLELQPNFTIKGFSITVGLAPEVFLPFSDAWRDAGMPAE
jgi:TolB-like protein/Tfp pilus assembly protein PilF